jgi:hypothetical protein
MVQGWVWIIEKSPLQVLSLWTGVSSFSPMLEFCFQKLADMHLTLYEKAAKLSGLHAKYVL